MRKKFVCMICSIVLSLSVVGCGSQKKDNSNSKAENTVSEKEVSNVSEVTAESSVEEGIDPQLKADFEYLVQYYTKTVDILKVLVSDSSKENDPEIQAEYKEISNNIEQINATKNKLKEIDQSTLNKAEQEYYAEKAKEVDNLATEVTKYNKQLNSDDSSENDGSDTGEVDLKFKETMDSYEAFFDEYVEFMKKYSESNDVMSMLTDYTDYLSKYADVMKKLNSIDKSKLSAADAAYYTEVSARISNISKPPPDKLTVKLIWILLPDKLIQKIFLLVI